MDEARFWTVIETAWKADGGKLGARRKLAEGKLSEEKAEDLIESLGVVLGALRSQLDDLTSEELLEFDRILERKLYDIDRAEIQEHTDGSDDGFLYARGFIVIAGKAYYDAVNANPSTAMMDMECEEMCYISSHLYEEKYGDIPPSGISRESCSNKAAWPGVA
jgi:Protein of unknown function (DUF4240)